MTAAHCVKNRQKETFNVVVGDHDTTTTADTNAMAVHSVEEIRIPTDYNDAKSKSDIALLRLTTPIEYNENVGPVCLPFSKRNATFVNETVTLAGWGSTEFGEPKSKTLQKVDVQTTDQQRCKTDFPNSDDTNICTYGEEKDSCQVRTHIMGLVVHQFYFNISFTVRFRWQCLQDRTERSGVFNWSN